jgi:tol-pal system protein YbgF
MFRQKFVPPLCLAAALGVAAVSGAVPAASQDLSTQERLDRLERDLNMLQRQVYRGVPPQALHGEAGGGAVNAEIRMERLEAQMRQLTGRVEEVANQITQVRQRVEQINADVEMRFDPGQGGVGPGPVAAATPPPVRPGVGSERPARRFPPPPPGLSEDEASPPRSAPGAAASPMPPGTLAPPPDGVDGSGRAFGTLTPPGSLPPADLASAAPGGRPSAAGLLPNGSATEQYNHAFGLLKKADYPAAEAELKAFIAQHPRDAMAGNAQYWLGETYYTRARYMEAASAFAEGYKRYPKSSKAADGLLKLGMSLARAEQKQNACVALAQLEHDFPNPGASIKQRAAVEKKHLGC